MGFDSSVLDVISTFPRELCIELLESIGIQCYIDEPIEVLREAVAVNVEDGTLKIP